MVSFPAASCCTLLADICNPTFSFFFFFSFISAIVLCSVLDKEYNLCANLRAHCVIFRKPASTLSFSPHAISVHLGSPSVSHYLKTPSLNKWKTKKGKQPLTMLFFLFFFFPFSLCSMVKAHVPSFQGFISGIKSITSLFG